jgi:hypothetical protein
MRGENMSKTYRKSDHFNGADQIGTSSKVHKHAALADPFQIETNCGSGSDSNARVPHPSDCLKSHDNPRGFENWT